MGKMNKKMGIVILALLISSMALSNATCAINLGSLAKKNSAEVKQGETAEFTIFFWNREDYPYLLSLNAEQVPDGWTVIIAPEKFIINQSEIGPPYDEGTNAEYVNTQHGNVKASPVKVYVKVPSSAELETYEVLIRARTHPLDADITEGDRGTGLSVLLERTFKLSVKVVKTPTFFEALGEMIASTVENLRKSITGMGSAIAETTFFEDLGKTITDNVTVENFKKAITGMGSAIASNPNIVLTVLISIGILLISWKVIYKYA